METGDLCIVGHEMGQLTNITYPRGSHHGAATRKQGYRLNSGRSIAMIIECLESRPKIVMAIHP